MTTRVNKFNQRSLVGILAGLFVLGALSPAGAVPQIESTYGGQSPWFQAELNSMAASGAASYRGGMSNILNPAGLAGAGAFRIDLGFAANHHEEDRFVPVFDTFDNAVTDMSIASNQNTWWNGGFALAAQLTDGSVPLNLGLSLADRYPFAYRFEEEIRDPNFGSSPRDQIIEERSYEVSGTLRNLSLGLATEIADRIAVGVSVHAAFGNRDERWTVRDNATDDANGDGSYDNADFWSLGGANATFGIQAKVHERLTLGLAYETALSVEGDYEISTYSAGDEAPSSDMDFESLKYPAYWRGGMAFYPRSDPKTVFTTDVVYSDWSKLEDSRWGDDKPFLQDVVDVRIGLQHTFYNNMNMRFGFRRYDSYADDEGGNSVWSAGGGFPVLQGELSFSLELNKLITNDVPHIFDYPADYEVPETARVDDRRFRFGIGWAREF